MDNVIEPKRDRLTPMLTAAVLAYVAVFLLGTLALHLDVWWPGSLRDDPYHVGWLSEWSWILRRSTTWAGIAVFAPALILWNRKRTVRAAILLLLVLGTIPLSSHFHWFDALYLTC